MAGRRRTAAEGTRRLLVAADAPGRLAAATAWLDALPPDAEVLVVAPSWDACDDLVRGALGPAGARFGVVRSTLVRLAARLAALPLAHAGRAPVTDLVLTAVAARTVHRLAAEGVFTYFGPVADRPGFPPAVARTLDELGMEHVGAAAMRRLPHGGGDLARLAEGVAAELGQDGLADRAALFASAVAAAAATPAPLGLPALLLDLGLGSAAEEALVAAIAAHAPRCLATAPAGDASGLARLARALGCAPEYAPVAGAGSLAALQSHLFETTTPPPAARDAGVQLTAWPGEARECVEIARAIQDEAGRGTRFDRMAVLLHAPANYVPHLEEAFARAELPYFFARGARRPHPAGRALLALLACAAEGLSARRFAEYLSLGQVPDPDAPPDPDAAWRPAATDLTVPADEVQIPAGDDEALPADPDAAPVIAGTLRAPVRWERLLVDAAVIGGQQRWKQRLDGLAAELAAQRAQVMDEDEARADRLDRTLRDLEHLRDFALPLVERLAALPRTARWGEWLDQLQALAAAALREPGPVLTALAELEPMAPVGPVEIDEVQNVLGPRLRDLTDPPPRRRYGHVFVGTTRGVRGMAFDVVFVPGLAENLCPGKLLEDPLLLDAQRRALAPATLITEAERAEGERLALRLAVGAARRRVWLSYPRVDVEKGRPRVPSFYALEVLKAAEGRFPGLDDLTWGAEQAAGARLGWPAPAEAGAAIDEAEYDLALLAPLLDADPETTVGTASYLLDANPHLARALRARGRRWLRRWTPADGLVDPEPLARAALARHQMAVRSYSPTALQHFAACPYRFFLQAIHRLAPREDPVALEVLDPLTRGGLYHDVQFGVLGRLRDAGLLPLRPETLDEVFDVLDTVLAAEAGAARERLAPAIPRVWTDEIDGLRADLREWLRRAAADGEGWVPDRFELAFGLPPGARERCDPASVPDPVPVSGSLVLRGSVDLVERRADGALRITDHKTGKVWAKDGVVVGGGGVLQPLLYALACERILAAPVVAGRLYYCTATGEYAERVVPLDTVGRQAVAAVVATIDEALRHGFLPAYPQSRACTFCDYRRVCGPYEETRTVRKPPERTEALRRLREMP